MFCPKCGMGNPDIAQFCESCGNKLPAPNYASVQLGKDGAPPSHHYSNKDFYQAFIGEKNQQYYLQKFQQFDQDGKTSATWHWPAFFITFYWLLYRKMWLAAFLYFISPYIALIAGALIVGILSTIIGNESGKSLVFILAILFYAALFFIPPLYANAWYYKHAKKKIAETAMYANDPQKHFGILAGRGGTSGVVLFIVLFFGFFFLIGTLAAIAIPAYHDYVLKSKNIQAIAVGKQATEAVTQYYLQQHKPPVSLADTEFDPPLPQSVQSIQFDKETSLVIVQLQSQSTDFTPSKIIFTPEVEENQNIVWTCSSEGIKTRLLPQECQ
jgi:Tfp pilus assembly protein PilE